MSDIKNEGLIKDSYELVLKEFQSLITVFYLLLVGIGMIFNYYKYAEFGIDIFQYADAFDFLIAPFQDVFIIVFSVLSTIVPYLAFRIDTHLKNNKPKFYSRINFRLDKKSWFNTYRIIVFFCVLFLYLGTAGSEYGEFFKSRIQDQPELSVVMQSNQVEKGKLIGKTNNMIFLLIDKQVTAVPVNSSVVKIEISSE